MSQGNNTHVLRLDAAVPGLEDLEQDVLLFVGVPESALYPDGTSVADVAAWNEFGTKNIPARPAIRATIDAYEDDYVKFLADALSGGTPPRLAMNQLGEYMATDIKAAIQAWDTPENAEATVKIKGVNDPLVETKRYAESIGHWVKE